jgi:hypothetical protein
MLIAGGRVGPATSAGLVEPAEASLSVSAAAFFANLGSCLVDAATAFLALWRLRWVFR